MAGNLNGAMIGAGIAAGALEAPFYNARMREANSRAQMSELQLKEAEQQAPVRQAQNEEQLAQLQASLYQTQAALAKQQSFDAFTRYRADGDPKHLNQWLNQNKANGAASSLTADMARLDRVSRSPENDKLLQAAGVTDLDGFYDHPEVNGSFVIGTSPAGERNLIDMNRLYGVTGFTQQMTDQNLQQLSKTAALVHGLRQGANLRGLQQDSALVQQVAAVTGQSIQDTYTMLQPDPKAGLDYVARTASGSGGGRGRGTMLERVVSQLQEANPDLTMRDAYTQALDIVKGGNSGGSGETQYVRDYLSKNPDGTREEAIAEYRQAGRDNRTSAIKNTEYSEEAKTELDNHFSGDFLNADLSKLDGTQRRVLDKNLTRIEQVGGLQFSPADQKAIRDITKTINTANYVANNLDDAQTGLIDSAVNELHKYVNNGSVKDKQATLAYNTLGAYVRDGLFGKQVSAADRRDMQKVFTTLGAQTGPVLASVKQTLQVNRDTLASLQQLGDPYVAKARTGMSLEQLDNTISTLDRRIDLLDRGFASGNTGGSNSGIKVRVSSNQPGGMSSANPAVSGERPSLQSIFGGNQ